MDQKDTLREIRDRIDIVELVREYVPLKKVGSNFVGLCPFHSETKPSFTVNPAKQIFHCFGCQVGGSVFDFVMAAEGVEFSEALSILAARAGVELRPLTESDRRRRRERDRRLALNEDALSFFRRGLSSSRAASYLESRGIDRGLADLFELGYAPDRWDGLASYLSSRGYRAAECVEAGLLVPGRRGPYDRFRDRLIFPIRDVSGGCVAFGGRAVGDGEPKYLNSPETPLFKKGRHLYGLNRASSEVRRSGTAVVVEGYIDCIAMHGAGFCNVVAPLGTALTVDQVRLLKRFASRAVFLFDGDGAGVKAALRALRPCMEVGLTAEVVVLPGGHDPDSFLREFGAGAMGELLSSAGSLLEFYLRELFLPSASASDKAAALGDLLGVVSRVRDPLQRAFFLQEISRGTGLDISLLEKQIALSLSGRVDGGVRRLRVESGPGEEEWLIVLMMEYPEAREVVLEKDILSLFSDGSLRRAGELILSGGVSAGGLDVASVLECIEDDSVRARVRSLLVDLGGRGDDFDAMRALGGCVRTLRRRHLRRRQEELSRRIAEAERAGDHEKRRMLLSEKLNIARACHEET